MNEPEQKLNLKDQLEKEYSNLFEPIQEEIMDDAVTDIEWDGKHLWITDLKKGCYMSDQVLDESYVTNLSVHLSNLMQINFNRGNPVLEANTDTLRISIWHDARCGKKSITIRKIPLKLRFGHKELVRTGYAPEEILNLIENCIKAHMNCVIGGQPHAGKTELLKYLTTFIPPYEKAGVYEDNQEIHYSSINPDKKCVEFYVDDSFSYSDVIKAGLRHNIDWQILSESRGPEVLELVNALSTGSYCLTTMHLEDVRRLPDRMYNMLGNQTASERFINNVYKYINLGLMVECDRYQQRKVTQVAFYTRQNLTNECTVIYEDGEFKEQLPEWVLERFIKYGIYNPYEQEKAAAGFTIL